MCAANTVCLARRLLAHCRDTITTTTAPSTQPAALHRPLLASLCCSALSSRRPRRNSHLSTLSMAWRLRPSWRRTLCESARSQGVRLRYVVLMATLASTRCRFRPLAMAYNDTVPLSVWGQGARRCVRVVVMSVDFDYVCASMFSVWPFNLHTRANRRVPHINISR